MRLSSVGQSVGTISGRQKLHKAMIWPASRLIGKGNRRLVHKGNTVSNGGSASINMAIPKWQSDLGCTIVVIALRAACVPTRPMLLGFRILAVRHQSEHEMLRQARDREKDEAFRTLYALRSGIEGTHSQAVRALGLRRTRYFGLPKTALAQVLTAAAINLIRIDAFLDGKKAAKTRVSRFTTLAPISLVS
jgi:hypothetical protein